MPFTCMALLLEFRNLELHSATEALDLWRGLQGARRDLERSAAELPSPLVQVKVLGEQKETPYASTL